MTVTINIGDTAALQLLQNELRMIGDHQTYDPLNTIVITRYNDKHDPTDIATIWDVKYDKTNSPFGASMSCAHVGSGNCSSRSFFYWSFWACFEILKLKVVWAPCSADNLASQKFLRMLGFRLNGISRFGFNGVSDAFEFEMLPEECRFWSVEGVPFPLEPVLTCLKPRVEEYVTGVAIS